LPYIILIGPAAGRLDLFTDPADRCPFPPQGAGGVLHRRIDWTSVKNGAKK
jgi:hypothetical protein